MRLSTLKNDPGYAAWKKLSDEGKVAHVFLDGKEAGFVQTADDEAGFVIRAKLNETGHVFAEGDEIVYETITGKVEIKVT